MGKNVLFIRANPVNPDSRVEKEVKALISRGYIVSVLAWDRSDNYPLRREQLNETLKSVIAYRIGIKSQYGSGMKNLKNLSKFQVAIRTFLKKNSFDVVHACDFDTAFTAYHTINHKRTKFVYDIFDYYADAFKIPGILKTLIVALDKRIINGADLTIICTEERKEQIVGAKPKSLIVIHNTPEKSDNRINDKDVNNRKPRICYVGILQPGRLLIELGEMIKNTPEIELHIGGFGIYEDYFKRLSLECENVFFYGRLPYNQTLELENHCDIMLAIYDPNNRNHQYAAPNKFYEALMLGKPILMVKNTGMANVVQENGIGYLIDYSANGLKQGVDILISKKAKWEEIGVKEKKLYIQNYSWTTMEERLLDGYSKLLM